MNLKRFTARSSREALALVREAFGPDAIVMSTRPSAEGVEVLAMPSDGVQQLEKAAAAAPQATRAPARRALPGPTVAEDVEQLQMSTLSFQDYVRERMLKRRRQELAQADPATESATAGPATALPVPAAGTRPLPRPAPGTGSGPAAATAQSSREVSELAERLLAATPAAAAGAEPGLQGLRRPLRETAAAAATASPWAADLGQAQPARAAVPPAATTAPAGVEMMQELKAMRGLIEQRFGALAFMEKLQRQPRQAQLAQKLLDCGFSPALIRKLVDGLPAEVDEVEWATQVLQRNLHTGEQEAALEDAGGVYALIGSTGVGKTTSTAKLAAAFAARHGAANLGLVTLDAYRIAAHEQLRAYGRILGVPVHTAHDRASLEDLLDLLAGKRMVLIDTAGMAQRDTRTAELVDMLSQRHVNRLLVVNAASQGETIEDVLSSYRAQQCRGIVLSKIDEAIKLGPALDALIRHRVKVLAVANGQRVPEDWHRLSAQALMQRALRGGGSAAWKLDSADVNLVFAAQQVGGQAMAGAGRLAAA